MLKRLWMAIKRQVLLWKLAGQQGWLDEFDYAERNLHVQRKRATRRVAHTKTLLAKLDGNTMLMGKAVVVVK